MVRVSWLGGLCYTDIETEFALKLPVITIPIMSYWDGQGLRFVPSSLPSLNRILGTIQLLILQARKALTHA